MTIRYADHVDTRVTTQGEAIPGEAQVQNNAGGFVYGTGPWMAFQRFLILGSEGGTYYVGERTLTLENAATARACVAEDGRRAIDLIVAISDGGRAPKNDPAILALAIAASAPDVATRAAALAALPKVCRIPTHLFHFLAFVQAQRGWSRMLRRAVADWYGRWDAETLAYEVVKYQQRDGWANRDALRLAHPRGRNSSILRWVIGAGQDAREVARPRGSASAPRRYAPTADRLPAIIDAYTEAQTAPVDRLVALIRAHGLTREMLPTGALTSPDVWAALVENMPLTALLRNLGNLSKVGLLTPLSATAATVAARFGDAEAIAKARVHPMAILVALKIYGSGESMRGSGVWTPVPTVVDALDSAFYLAFGNVVPTGKRLLVAVDVSGSMGGGSIAGSPLTPAEGAAALALLTARTEAQYYVMGFADSFRDLGITPKMRLDDVVRKTARLTFGGTDCGLPMVWAQKQKVDVDGFVVITDNETWAGTIHPSQALRAYRSERGIDARQVVMGMTATEFTIADPTDPGALDVVGFDTATPQVVSEFLRG